MDLILDTNALSDFAEGDPEIGVLLQRAAIVALPTVVLGEYKYGLLGSRRRAEYERWLSQTLDYCQVLPIEVATADEYARIRHELRHKGNPIPVNDMWIAALARQHNMKILSRDKHFDAVADVVRINW